MRSQFQITHCARHTEVHQTDQLVIENERAAGVTIAGAFPGSSECANVAVVDISAVVDLLAPLRRYVRQVDRLQYFRKLAAGFDSAPTS